VVDGGKRVGKRNQGRLIRHPTRRDGIIALATLVLPGAVAIDLYRHRADIGVVTIWAAIAMGLPLIWLAWATYRESRASDSAGSELGLPEIADELAIAVGTQWEVEAATWRLNDPYPLPVSWEAADPSLAGSWDVLVKLASVGAGWPGRAAADAWAHGPEELAGAGNELPDVLARVPTRRLVVLGEPGAGKTMLMVRFVLDLLRRRQPGGPVPVLASLSSWNPDEQNLIDWLTRQLLVAYPALAAPEPGRREPNRAAALLSTGLVLLILDGLDEIPSKLRGSAVAKISDALRPGWPLVLTCRAEEFRDALRPRTGPEVTIHSAAVIQLRPLDTAAARDYLRGGAGGPEARARWEPVLAVLGTQAPAGQALTTPLMLGLARIIYNRRPGELTGTLPDPAELISASLPDRGAVESRLFDGFVPAAYRDTRTAPGRSDGKRAGRAETFLIHLAHNLAGRAELNWWELQTGGPGVATLAGWGMAVSAAVAAGLAGPAAFGGGVVTRLTAAIAVGIGVRLMMLLTIPNSSYAPAPRPGLSWGWNRAWGHSLWIPIRVALASALAFAAAAWLEVTQVGGTLGGAAWLLACVLALGLQPKNSGPTEAVGPRLSLVRDRRATLVILPAAGLVIGPGLGLACGTALGLLAGLTSGVTAGLSAGLVVFPAATIVAYIVLSGRPDEAVANRPVAAMVGSPMIGLLAAVDTSVIFALGNGQATGTIVGCIYGGTLGFGAILVQSAWARWLIGRIWLFGNRRVPWHLLRFLEDAHKRGVLRQSGAAYQFRHLGLQHSLATRTPKPRP
jgi:NACHT domain